MDEARKNYDLMNAMLDEIENTLDGSASMDPDGSIRVKIRQEPRTDLPPLVGYGDTIRAGDIVNIYESDVLGNKVKCMHANVRVRSYTPINREDLIREYEASKGSQHMLRPPTLHYDISSSLCIANPAPMGNAPFWRVFEVVKAYDSDQG
jgi:hypothetical protein